MKDMRTPLNLSARCQEGCRSPRKLGVFRIVDVEEVILYYIQEPI